MDKRGSRKVRCVSGVGNPVRLYRILLLKKYFDRGYGLTHYFFKLIAVFGLTSQMLTETFYILAAYTLGCFLLGWAWFHFGMVETEFEIDNRYNPFQREMRKVFKV